MIRRRLTGKAKQNRLGNELLGFLNRPVDPFRQCFQVSLEFFQERHAQKPYSKQGLFGCWVLDVSLFGTYLLIGFFFYLVKCGM